MKKQYITVMLLIWLFSQQVFAVVWAVPSAGMGCGHHSQNDCVPAEHMGHGMPTILGVDGTNSQEDGVSMPCEHCCGSTCQPSLMSNTLLPLVNPAYKLFEALSTDALVDHFRNTLYRPPILT